MITDDKVSNFSIHTYAVGIHKNRLIDDILMHTHSIYLYG